MKAIWRRYAERIDAANLRERALVFLALTLILLFLANAALLQPLRAQQKRFAAETAQRQKELQTFHAEVQRLALQSRNDPNIAVRAKQAELREQLAQIEARIVEEQRRFTPPERMRAMLQDMLQRNRNVTVVDLRSLPVAQVGSEKGAASGQLYRHGLELVLTGTYGDLYDYLRSLEQLPTQLYWRQLSLNVSRYPAVTLKFTAYTVSFDRAWIIV